MRLKFLGTEILLPTTAELASNFNNAREVRLIHDEQGNTTHLVTILNSTGSTIATFSMPPGNVIVVRKEPTHKIYAASDDIRGVAVSYIS